MLKRVLLSEADLPDRWYNILPDLPVRLPGPLNPVTMAPLQPDDLVDLLPHKVIEHEFTQDRWVEIPERVRDVYKIWRPSPLVRAERLERALDTPAHIYFKFEGVSPSGSHKPNTAVVQAYYAAEEGARRLTTETGAGQWGSALSFAGALFGLEVNVYMVRASFEQKPYRKSLMQSWGAQVFASPTQRTEAGRQILAKNPDSPGSIGIAISEAVADALSRDDTKFALGSIMNNVLLHQTVIGLEAKKQMEIMGEYPDVVIGCVGGGSTAVPNVTVVAKIQVIAGQPVVKAVFAGGYIDATASPKADVDLPGRWVDWEMRVPAPSWISIAWRDEDDPLHTGARSALGRLLKDVHTEPYDGPEVDWASWRTFAAALGDHRLTMAGLRPDLWAIGHSTATTAAVIQQDGTILADSPESASLAVPRSWLSAWEAAGRPAPETYTPKLLRADDGAGPAGWHLRLSR
ncbi:TrpB-like pyridoxal phosphate-dependent enzyme [Streptomyces lydicus]|uniref:TrpB-like pyridoxal phosphate-dependent enzyme n=1 Tax=Streptomyces lydicus TaxID=47763 RepID=UPI003787E83E